MQPRTPRVSAALAAWIALAAFSDGAAAQPSYGGSEYVGVEVAEAMPVDAMLALLDRTVGQGASSGRDPVELYALRSGTFATAVPLGPYLVLRFESDRGGQTERETIAEVAVPAASGQTFYEIVEAALRTAQGIPSRFLQPWELHLKVENPRGGEVVIKVEGDSQGRSTLGWAIEGPNQPIDRYRVPSALRGHSESQIGGTVHFPLRLQDFVGFVDRAYGRNAPDRFKDFQLFPHRWLRLTVTGDGRGESGADRVVFVHFDAVTGPTKRVFVAEAPASTDVGARFFDETVARMEEMLAEEGAQAGSSRPWRTDFFYDSADTGTVIVVVNGEEGRFEVEYQVATPVQEVRRGQLMRATAGPEEEEEKGPRRKHRDDDEDD